MSFKKVSIITIAILLAIILMPSRSVNAAFPGSNGNIAFSNFEFKDSGVVNVLSQQSFDSGSLSSLNSEFFFFSPRYSSDGKRITVSGFGDLGNDNESNIYTMNSDGSNVTNITNIDQSEFPDRSYYRAAYSSFDKSGSKIAFTGYWDELGDRINRIYSINTVGSGVQELTNSSGGVCDMYPVYSPDGNKIAFLRVDEESDQNTTSIFTMNSDGTDQQLVKVINAQGAGDCLASGAFEDFSFSQSVLYEGEGISTIDWSPDGSKIVYSEATSADEGTVTTYKDTIYVTDLNGNSQEVISTTSSSDNAVMQNAANNPPEDLELTGLANPQFTPDGKIIYKRMFVSVPYVYNEPNALWEQDGGSESTVAVANLFTANTNGSGEVQISSKPQVTGASAILEVYKFIMPSMQPTTVSSSTSQGEGQQLADTGGDNHVPLLASFIAIIFPATYLSIRYRFSI